MIPVIALVGRPNVGKSTLFNRITRSRDALVADLPGLTRDRKYGEARHNDSLFIVIDTGGITGGEEGIDAHMAEQSMTAVDEADAVLLLGHGTGESDMRQVLLTYLGTHRRDLLDRIVGVVTLDHASPSDEALLALAREHFGNLPQRRPILVPGQAVP